MASTLAAVPVEGRMARLMLLDIGGMGQRGIIRKPVRVHMLPQRMILP